MKIKKTNKKQNWEREHTRTQLSVKLMASGEGDGEEEGEVWWRAEAEEELRSLWLWRIRATTYGVRRWISDFCISFSLWQSQRPIWYDIGKLKLCFASLLSGSNVESLSRFYKPSFLELYLYIGLCQTNQSHTPRPCQHLLLLPTKLLVVPSNVSSYS